MKKYVAELIGTYALVFCGTGAIVINSVTEGTVTHLGIAISFGAIVTAIIYTFGEISGAHINPAVSIGFWLAKKFDANLVIPYVIAQLSGAVLAGLTLYLLFPDATTLGATVPFHGQVLQTFVLEIILTYFLMLVIIHVATGSKEQGLMAGLAIGLVVMLEALFAGPITGASMNPARSIAPAIVSGNIQHLWAYIAAPIIGATLAVITWRFLKNKE